MDTKEQILALLKKQGEITTRQIATKFSFSRKYAHKLLKQLREEGEILLIGKTNNAKYIATSDKDGILRAKKLINQINLNLKNTNLSESMVFDTIEKQTGILIDVPENIIRIFRHAFTEMLNNAIDHSQSKKIKIQARRSKTALTFVIRDFGIGVFNNVRDTFHLPGTLAAIQDILKGKVTTAPKEHTGEGIFFTSKMSDIFTIDSFEKQLTINNLLPDIFISDRKILKGTRVSFSIHLTSKQKIEDIFNAFTGSNRDEFAFNKTKVTVKLFQFGRDLPSRSEAKRVTVNLENFQEIEFDFSDVKTVGQSFTDEIFRVWQLKHPKIKLTTSNVNENISFMIKRVGGK